MKGGREEGGIKGEVGVTLSDVKQLADVGESRLLSLKVGGLVREGELLLRGDGELGGLQVVVIEDAA